MTPMAQTPITDALIPAHGLKPHGQVAGTLRKLETDRAALIAALDEAEAALCGAAYELRDEFEKGEYYADKAAEARAALAKVRS